MPRKTEVRASIIIPSYSYPLEECLRSILDQKVSFRYEIIVVDSSPGLSAFDFHKKYPEVRLKRFVKRLLPGAARNLGAKFAKGQLLIFLDSDCVLPPAWLQSFCESLENLGERSILAGKVENRFAGRTVASADHWLSFSEFCQGKRRKEKNFLPSCNLGMRASLFRDLGGFPSDLAAAEDVVFCHWAREFGEAKLFLDPALTVFHSGRESVSDFLEHQHHFGFHSAKVRQIYSLKGASLARAPWAAPLAGFLRAPKVFQRSFKFVLGHPKSGCLMAAGLFAWGTGFVQGSLSARERRQLKGESTRRREHSEKKSREARA